MFAARHVRAGYARIMAVVREEKGSNMMPPLSSANEGVMALIPAFNEEGAIGQVVEGVRRAMPGAHIVVIDDCSTDGTAAAASAAGAHVVRLPCNLGIGGAVPTGLKFARERLYDVVVRLDGDGQHDPAEIPALYELLKKGQADVVIGSRFLGMDEPRVRIPMSRLLGIKTFAFLVSLLTRQQATDTTSGFMCMNRQAVALLADFLPQDYPEVEGRIILHKAGLAVAETPACMRARVAGISSITAWRSIYYAVKVSIAVLICAMKDIPLAPKGASEDAHYWYGKERENDHDSSRSAHRRHPIQPYPVVGDRAADTEAQTT
jgi:hypothetical protein